MYNGSITQFFIHSCRTQESKSCTKYTTTPSSLVGIPELRDEKFHTNHHLTFDSFIVLAMVSFLFLLLVMVASHVHSTSALFSVIYSCEYFTSDVCDDDEGTNNAMMNYGSCFFSACGGHEVVVSNYQNCVGNTFLRLYDNNGYELSHQEDVYWVST